MQVYAIADEYKELADEWLRDACRFKRASRKIECLRQAIPLYEYAERLGYLGGRQYADACRKELEALCSEGR